MTERVKTAVALTKGHERIEELPSDWLAAYSCHTWVHGVMYACGVEDPRSHLNDASTDSNGSNGKPRGRSPSSERRPLAPRVNPSDARAAEARRRQREAQRDARDALRREKERKAAVEHALDKLRKEREARLKERKAQEQQRVVRNRQHKVRLERKKKEALKKAKRTKAEQDRPHYGDRKEDLLLRKEKEARAIELRR